MNNSETFYHYAIACAPERSLRNRINLKTARDIYAVNLCTKFVRQSERFFAVPGLAQHDGDLISQFFCVRQMAFEWKIGYRVSITIDEFRQMDISSPLSVAVFCPAY